MSRQLRPPDGATPSWAQRLHAERKRPRLEAADRQRKRLFDLFWGALILGALAAVISAAWWPVVVIVLIGWAVSAWYYWPIFYRSPRGGPTDQQMAKHNRRDGLALVAVGLVWLVLRLLLILMPLAVVANLFRLALS